MTEMEIVQTRINNAIMPKLERFAEILEKYPDRIPVEVAAEFLGTSPGGLRTSLGEERCPVGYSWNAGHRSGICIPTVRFYFYIMEG